MSGEIVNQMTLAPWQSACRALLLICGALLLTSVFACSSDDAAGPAPTDTATFEPDDEEPRLWIKDGDELRSFENGDSVVLGETNVEIYVSPYPPTRSANIDFYVTRAGEPAERANVSLQYDMTVMEHGPFELLAVPTGRGHYLAPMDFAMDGEFWVNVSVDDGNGDSVINMLVRAQR